MHSISLSKSPTDRGSNSARWLKRILPLLISLSLTMVQAQERDNNAEAVVGLKAYAAFKAGNYEEARQIWQGLADKGNTTAMINLANLFQQGKGVPEDQAHALRFIIEAAQLGDSRAQYELGIEYEKGIILPRDIDKAAMWLHKSAQQGDSDGQFAYAVMLATAFGRGTEQASKTQIGEAIEWFRKALAAGHPDAAKFIQILSD